MSPPVLISLITVLTAVLTSPSARAAELSPERPVLPAFSGAGEDGAATLWRNPASLAFDRDPSAWLGWSQDLGGGPATLSGALQGGPLAAGVLYRNGPDDQGWLSLANGAGIKLGRRVALGVGLGWQVPEGPENNFVTWDVGLGWRPAQWLGVSLAARNLNNPAEDLGVTQSFGGGVAWRPFDGMLILGVDYEQPDLAPDVSGRFSATARIEPTDGLVLRAYGDQDGRIGAGMELFWGRMGVGMHGLGDLAEGQRPVGLGYLITGDGDKSLFEYGHKVPEFVLDADFPYQRPTGLLAQPEETWLHLIRRIQEAIDDPGVKGFVLHVDRAPPSWAHVQELRDLVAQARARGKVTVAYLDRDAGNASYLLAVAADRVYLHPAANLDLVGLSMELTYLRGTLDLLGVEPQYVKRSEYKSAPEQWTRHGPSEAARAQLDALLDGLSDELARGVADGRARSPEQVRRLVDGGPFTADDAEARGLVDGVFYPDQLEERLEESFRRGFELDPDYRLDDEVTGWPAAREIAVVYVDGVIVPGPSSQGGLLSGRTAGSDTIVRQLDQARRDDAVQAVVLRVDSPGGSAFASDEIWRATQRLKESGKPLIVSRGGVAASGGYYVAAGADAIYAEPGTITGSIGVFSGKFSLGGLYDKVGVETEILSRGRNAAMYSASRPMDEAELETMDRLVGATYAQFKDRVATGRGLSAEQVEEVARGRVWSGADAKEQGLVDELGGIDAAIERARAEAGLREGSLVELVTYGDRDLGPLPRRAVQAAAAAIAPDLIDAPALIGGVDTASLLPPPLDQLHIWTRLAQDPVWALMPWELRIR